MRSVGNGARLPQLETEGASLLYVMTNGLVDAMLLSDPNARPSSKALVSTLANLGKDALDRATT